MCLRTYNPEIKIADRDIRVYKTLCVVNQKYYPNFLCKLLGIAFKRKVYFSESANYKYEIGKTNNRIKLDPCRIWDNLWVVNEGYHSDVRPHCSNATFIIPKGSEYIEGWYNDDTSRKNYVSSKIIFEKIIE